MYSRVAPWGNAPTPLLPRWYRENLAPVLVPHRLHHLNPRVVTVGQLADFWTDAEGVIDRATLSALAERVKGRFPPDDYVVLPDGMPRGPLAKHPLSTRTQNTLETAGLFHGSDAVTVRQLLSLRGFGFLSLVEFMCVVEPMLGQNWYGSAFPVSATQHAGPFPTIDEAPASISGLLRALFAITEEFYGTHTLADALELDLLRIADSLGIVPALDSRPIGELTRGRSIRKAIVSRLEELCAKMSGPRRRILIERIWATRPETLQVLAMRTGVTRERIRQIQEQVVAEVEGAVGTEMDIVAAIVRARLPLVPREAELDRAIAELLGGSAPNSTEVGARQMLRSRLQYSVVDGKCFSKEALDVARQLRADARALADDVGLVEEADLRSVLSGDQWCPHLQELIALAGLCVVSSRLAVRKTRKARAKAALLQIGRPATREEIGKVAEIDGERVGAQLSAIPSIGRVDLARWWLVDDMDHVYKGIPEEITAVIRQDGGATTLTKLLEELPRRFGVSPQSVRVYAKTPQFARQGGYVSLADTSTLELRGLWEVVDGYDDGAPYWTFFVYDRYLSGYSLVGFPPELAQHLGCEPNGKRRIAVGYPDGCRELSINWRLASTVGVSVGYLADPLQRLGVREGDRARLIIRRTDLVEVRKVD